jgi:3-oxoadipate enol-lactonase
VIVVFAFKGDAVVSILSLNSRGKIDIYDEEEGSGDPLVLVGGFTATVEVWGKLRPLLAEKYRVIMPDNRGSGRTRIEDDDADRTPKRFAHDVFSLINALGLERVHLMGSSMGGMIVQEFGFRHPDRLRSLIVASSHFGGEEKVAAAPGVRDTRKRGGVLGATEEERIAALETIFHSETIRTSPEVVEFYDQNKRTFPHSAEELEARTTGMDSFDLSNQVGDIRVPTMVISGSHDYLVPTENSRLLAARIPGAKLAIVENTGHHFYSERPEASAEVILEFLSGL